MPGVELLHAFKALSRKDQSALCELAACPFFNKKQEVERLCSYLAKNVRRAEPGVFSKEKLYQAAFPGSLYNDGRLRLTMTWMLKLIERYLAIAQMENDGFDADLYLLKALRERGNERRFEKKCKELGSALEAQGRRDSRIHHQRYTLSGEELEGQSGKQRSSRLDLHPLHNQLTIYYLSEMLRHASSALTHQSISAQVYDMNLLEQVLELAEQFGVDENPAVAIYYHACKSLQEPEDRRHFDRWKNCMLANEALFSPAELRSIYLLGINFCIRRMNQGGQEFIREAFDLYRSALAKDFLTEKGYLTAFSFKNIIRIGTALGEHAWTQQFFETYQKALHPSGRSAVVAYNGAFLHFRRQEYHLAMPLLQQAEFDDTLNNLDARRMLLRSYFELGETEALDLLINSFKAYLHRQKDLGYHREMYLNLLNFVRKMIELPPGDRAQWQKLERKVSDAKWVAEKEWLLGKIQDRLENR
jgi:hypothetical protein